MVIGEVIQRVQSLYSKGIQSDDSRLSSRHIYNKLLTIRSQILIEDYRKNRNFNDYTKQTLYIDMTSASNLPCGKSATCKSTISKEKIPVFIFSGDNNIIDVESVDGLITFNKINFSDVRNIAGNKYTGKSEFYYLKNRFLKTVNSKIKKLGIGAVWEDPIQIEIKSQICNGEQTSNYQQIDFYTPPNLTDRIIGLTSTELVGEFIKMKEDITNDTTDN